jgi:hypothetical protein
LEAGLPGRGSGRGVPKAKIVRSLPTAVVAAAATGREVIAQMGEDELAITVIEDGRRNEPAGLAMTTAAAVAEPTELSG